MEGKNCKRVDLGEKRVVGPEEGKGTLITERGLREESKRDRRTQREGST